MSSMLLLAAAAAVAPVPTVTADQAIAVEKALTSTAPPKRSADCSKTTDREIVVCRQQEVDPATQYVPSDVDSGVPDDGGIPRAAPHTMLPPCINSGIVAFCAQHLGRMPRHPLIIDVKDIPEPPAGSDADRMSKGEIPTP